ncbi:transposase [Nonomuraea sp. NPDC046802]|uniref:transposase n=1 Tax=Nonomuraea sp. NPDC046802 TaxID=3154919 RepID=UPI0033E9C310
MRLVAACFEVHERTVWRWLERARPDEQTEPQPDPKFTMTADLLAHWALLGGNTARLYRELVEQQRQGGPHVPSLRTVYRAVNTALTPGEQAGIRKGERARRRFDVYLRRPTDGEGHHRNAVWEGDHVELPVKVDVDGQLRKPWVTWFIDCATDGICGLAITPTNPNRGSILAALRYSIMRDDRYGPFGGVPAAVRIDRGRDFLSKTVTAALGRFAVLVGALPGYHPHLKGSIEALNGAVQTMFCKSLPHYTGQPTELNGAPIDPDAPALMFEDFVERLLDWVREWNTDLPKPALSGRTPQQAWRDDPWPIDDIPAEDLRLFMLEDDGRERTITGNGVSWRKRLYVGDWMTGMGGVGRKVRLRYMPHHDHEVEVFDAATGRHLGPAYLSNQASKQQIAEVQASRRAASKRVNQTLKAAAKKRRVRYKAATEAEPPRVLGALTAEEARTELEQAEQSHRPLPFNRDLIPLRPPAPGWVLPKQAQPKQPPQVPTSEQDDQA